MNTPVSFEIAKLLKEKGYDYPSRGYYEYALTESYNEEDGYSGSFGWRKGETNLQEGYFVNNSHGDHSSDAWYMCARPTIADVVMWLYTTYDIWISVKKDWGNGIFLGFEYIIEDVDGISSGNTFDSLPEAYTKAIEYCLNELI